MSSTRHDRDSVTRLIARIDRMLSVQIGQILRHPQFQALEAAWRGLHHLVARSDAEQGVRVRVLDVSKEDLRLAEARHQDSPDERSPMREKFVEAAYRDDELPLGILIADYEFDRSSADIELLWSLAVLAQDAPVPLVAGAAPGLLDHASWSDLTPQAGRFGLRGLDTLPRWRLFLLTPESEFVYLGLPRLRVARHPPTSNAGPAGFVFEEAAAGVCPPGECLINAAWGLAVEVARDFAETRWFTTTPEAEESAHACVRTVPSTPTAIGGRFERRPEVELDPVRSLDLAQCGLIALTGSDRPLDLTRAVSMHRRHLNSIDPGDLRDGLDPAQSLPCRLILCRLAAHLRVLAANILYVGNSMSTPEADEALYRWIKEVTDPRTDPPDDVSGRRPPIFMITLEVENHPREIGMMIATVRLLLDSPSVAANRVLIVRTGLRQGWMFR